MIKLPETLPPPQNIPENLPKTAKWLAGEGAGSWFVITKNSKDSVYHITRYSPEGNEECSGWFIPDRPLALDKSFEVIFPSHCAKVTILQAGKKITLRKHLKVITL